MKYIFAALLIGWASWAHAEQPIDCVIEPAQLLNLGSDDEGRLEVLRVSRGDIVTEGQILAQLESELQKFTVQATSIRASVDVNTKSNLARLRFQKLQIERVASLVERSIATQKKLEEIAVERDLAVLAVKASEVEFEIARIEALNAQAMLERRFIRSPINGLVVDTQLSVGEFVVQETPILTIANLSTLYVEVFAPLSIYRSISVGDIADVHIPPPIDAKTKAVIVVIDRVFDAASGTFGVRLEIDNSDQNLPAGLRCQVVFSDIGKRGSNGD